MKIISRRAHGVADYLLVAVLLSLPVSLGLRGAPRVLSYSLAFAHLLVTGFSSFPPGAFPLIPLKIHGYVEVVAGFFLFTAPWLFHFADVPAARTAFLVLGALVLVLHALTNYDRRESALPRPPGDRRRWYARKR